MSISQTKQSIIELNISVKLSDINMNVSGEQMQVASQCLGYYKHLQNTLIFLQHRPNTSVRADPKQWWLYAKKCICLYLKRSKWDWLELKEQKELRQVYAIQYEDFLLNEGTEKMRRLLQDLEDEMSLLNILLVRKKVEREIDLTLRDVMNNKSLFLTRRRKKQNHQPTVDDPNMVYFTLCGDCTITDLQLTITSESDTSINELLTLQVCDSLLSLTKNDHVMNYEASLGDIRCTGIAKGKRNKQKVRNNLLVWTESTQNDPVLKLTLTNSTVSRYYYKVDCSLRQSIIIADWDTVESLACVVALLTNTHQDLKDAVKEGVKEVGRESQIKLRHFIDNKKLAIVTADIHIPAILITHTHREVLVNLGHLTVDSIQNDSNIGICQRYNATLKGTQVIYNERRITSHNSWQDMFSLIRADDDVTRDDNVLASLSPFHCLLAYNMYYSLSTPSNLLMELRTSQVYICTSDKQLEKVLRFSFDQLQLVKDIVSKATAVVGAPRQEEVDGDFIDNIPTMDILSGSSFEPLVSTVYSDLMRYTINPQPLFARSTKKLPRGNDYTVFKCKCDISKVVAQYKHQKGRWGVQTIIASEIRGVSLEVQMREQSTQLDGVVSQVTVKNLSKFSNGLPVKLLDSMDASEDFLCLRYINANPLTPLFPSVYKSRENELDISIESFRLYCHRESLIDLMSSISSIDIPPFKTLIDNTIPISTSNITIAERLLKSLHSDASPDISDAIRCHCVFTLGTLTFTIATDLADSILDATIYGCELLYCDMYSSGQLDFNVQQILVKNLLSGPSNDIILSNTHNLSQLLTTKLSWEETSNVDVSINGTISLDSLRFIWYHKLINSFRLFVNELITEWHKMVDGVNVMLMTSLRAKNKAKKFPKQSMNKPAKPKLLYSATYKVDMLASHQSIAIPRGTISDTTNEYIHITLDQLQGRYMNRPVEDITKPLTTIIEEPDTIIINGGITSNTTTDNNMIDISMDSITINCMSKYTGNMLLFRADTASLTRGVSHFDSGRSSPWKLIIPNIEVGVAPQILVVVPEIIRGNFTGSELSLWEEPRNVAPPTASHDPIPSLSPVAPPIMDILMEELSLTLSHDWTTSTTTTDDPSHVASVIFKKIETNISLHPLSCTVSVSNITGMEHVGCDKYNSNYKIISRSSLIDRYSYAKDSPLVEVTFSVNTSDDDSIIMEGSLSGVCVCVWPHFLNSLVDVFEEYKHHQEEYLDQRMRSGRRTKRRSLGNAVTPFKIPARRSTQISKQVRQDSVGQKQSNEFESNKSRTKLDMTFKLDECLLVILEDPVEHEIITPGLFIELHSSKPSGLRPSSPAAVCNIVTSSDYVDLNVCSCQLEARLCLHGENVIPLNHIIPSTSLIFQYKSSQSIDFLSLTISCLVIHLTNELKQIIESFYRNINRKTDVSGCDNDTSAIYDTDICVIKTIDRTTIIPDDYDEDEDDDDDGVEDVTGCNDTAEKTNVCQQECNVEISELLINFDIMCGGDSSTVMCIHSAVRGSINQWKRDDMTIDVQLTVEAFIYNEMVAAWNPLIEPLEDDSIGGYRPYKLKCKVSCVNEMISDDPTRSLASANVEGTLCVM
jgi:hypothetical protein